MKSYLSDLLDFSALCDVDQGMVKEIAGTCLHAPMRNEMDNSV